MNAMKFAIPLFVALAYGPVQAQTPILGPELASFAVLGATTVTTDPPSTVFGNVGVWSSGGANAITGGFNFIAGSLQAGTARAELAQGQLDAAILAVNAGSGTPIGGSLDAWQSSHGGVITPGTYDVGAGLNLSGNLFLDGLGSNTAVWRFRFSSTLITAEDSNVFVQGVGNGAGVGIYWSVGSAATLNGDTFAGNVLANQLISSNGGLTMGCGRLLSAEAAVTLIGDTIGLGCTGFASSGGLDQGNPGGIPSAIPEPEIYAMMAVGLGLLGWVGRRKKLKEAAAA